MQSSCRFLARLDLLAREADAEVRAGPLEHLDLAVVQLHVFLHDGKAEAAALDRRHAGVGAAEERLEDALALVRRDSRPFVQDLEDGIAALLVELDGDEAAL